MSIYNKLMYMSIRYRIQLLFCLRKTTTKRVNRFSFHFWDPTLSCCGNVSIFESIYAPTLSLLILWLIAVYAFDILNLLTTYLLLAKLKRNHFLLGNHINISCVCVWACVCVCVCSSFLWLQFSAAAFTLMNWLANVLSDFVGNMTKTIVHLSERVGHERR